MKLSEEMAVRLHRMMWSDMQKELGDTNICGRSRYKEEWLAKHFPGEHFMHNCFLCEYVMQQTGNIPLLRSAECKLCPIKWPGDDCSLREREGGVNYLQSPISEILALPARHVEENETVPVHARLSDRNRADMYERIYNQIKECLATESKLPASATIHDHVAKIKEKAVQQSNLSKIYGDTKMKLAKSSGLPAAKEVTDHIKAIQEKAVDDYFAKMPLAKAMTTDIDEAFKQHAEEQMAPIFEQLSKASGLSENNHSVLCHIDWIKDKARQEGRDDKERQLKQVLSMSSGLIWDNEVAKHIAAIDAKAHEDMSNQILRAVDARDAEIRMTLAKESYLNGTASITAHINAIYSNGFENGKKAESEHIMNKIGEILKK